MSSISETDGREASGDEPELNETEGGQDSSADDTAEYPADANEPEAQDEPADTVASLRSELESVREQLAAAEEKVLRTLADMENLRRRTSRDVEGAHKFGQEKLARELLPVKDSLDMGLAAARAEGAADETALNSIREGLELTEKQFDQALQKIGIELLDPVGQPFDPEQHEAMAMQPAGDAEPNTVLTVIQRGYSLNGRLLRPARVLVAQDSGD